ncbi:hypothetical protein XENOCAPTIV_027367 [Xenoophorus captivus]|uniref:Uncharacterized protein n=1 Tax=Xenoophorus captivus TaxID=1517983 RepID=A0ABV0Q6D9_9TELE
MTGLLVILIEFFFFYERSPMTYWYNWGVKSPGAAIICLVSCCPLHKTHTGLSSFPTVFNGKSKDKVGFVVFSDFMFTPISCHWQILRVCFYSDDKLLHLSSMSAVYAGAVHFFHWYWLVCLSTAAT